MNRKTPELKTMRANLKKYNMPKKLMLALSEYEELRVKWTYDGAEALIDGLMGDLTGNHIDRLARGLKLTKAKYVYRVGKSSGIDWRYILKHRDYFETLSGLFYFNGSDKMVSKILKKAWQLGYVPKN